ncbi:MAG: hypothetical protein H7A39_03950 [Chlamydiales bacterium]|nr:hypothetical protein [Chlamydiales bacterium]
MKFFCTSLATILLVSAFCEDKSYSFLNNLIASSVRIGTNFPTPGYPPKCSICGDYHRTSDHPKDKEEDKQEEKDAE